jgi:hypothetical protein
MGKTCRLIDSRKNYKLGKGMGTGDSSMGSVSSSSAVLGSVHLDVSDDKLVDVQLLDLPFKKKIRLG